MRRLKVLGTLLAGALMASGCEYRSTAHTSIHGQTGPVSRHVAGKPVSATLQLSHGAAKAGETIELAVTIDVAALWEIRTLDSEFAAAATKLELALPPGVEAKGEWQAPSPGRSVSGDGHPAYAGAVVFKRQLVVTRGARPGEQPIVCRAAYQACNEQQCLAPAHVELAVNLRVE
ncbi:MAG TPA: hypothetical protein VFW87_11905 [Pirellulales bacterium]|nr:hypothetical protein [Pirellulales bacterium]